MVLDQYNLTYYNLTENSMLNAAATYETLKIKIQATKIGG